MSDITWPTTRACMPQSFDIGIRFNVQINVMRDGSLKTRSLPGARWVIAMYFGDKSKRQDAQRGELEAILLRLRGGENRAALWRMDRFKPNGSLSGTPELANNVPAGATSLPLADCNGDVWPGDMLGCGGQLFEVVQASAPVSGNMTVAVEPAVRSALTITTPVVVERPTSLFIPRSPELLFPSAPGKRGGFSVEFVEAFA